jgi:adenosylmethionine-8-amino-7-oxononanoate aminotransferase
MTGFGRTGKMFASEYMEQQPDIVCLSKGLTGGTLPLGATACNEKIYEAFYEEDRLKTFFHGHSFTANPIACTAALASLDLLQKEECYWQTKMISASHSEFLNGRLNEVSGKIKNRRRLGTILAFEVETGKDGYLNNISREITDMALKKGVYLRPLGNTVYIMPPYCISQQQLAKVYEVLLEIVSGF